MAGKDRNHHYNHESDDDYRHDDDHNHRQNDCCHKGNRSDYYGTACDIR